MIPVKIGSQLIGPNQPCCIVYEAGATHTGFESAMELTRRVFISGANAIKFQMLDPDRLMADKTVQFNYQYLDPATKQSVCARASLYNILKRRQLTRAEWVKLAKYIKSLGMLFFCTACFDDEVDFLVELGCHSIKIASSDINHLPLIRKAAQTGLCIQIDTGNATLDEVSKAVQTITNQGNSNIIIHHCPVGYPATLKKVDLRIIQTLRQMFSEFPVAFSDHNPGHEMDLMALALGVNMIEKTITMDRTINGPEHMASLEGDQLAEFVTTIRNAEIVLGKSRKDIPNIWDGDRLRFRRGVYLIEAVVAGQALGQAKVEFSRPGSSFGPDMFEALSLDLVFNQDLPAGACLWADCFGIGDMNAK